MLQMRAIAAELESIAEALGGLLPPRLEGMGGRQTVERIVDLHSIKIAGVVGKPVLMGEIPGVEHPSPVVILVA